MKRPSSRTPRPEAGVSVLNREPMGMKPTSDSWSTAPFRRFSAQPRADGDEAVAVSMSGMGLAVVSVLNREPMGMKLCRVPGRLSAS